MSYGQRRHHLLITVVSSHNWWCVWLHCNGGLENNALEAIPPPHVSSNTSVELTLGDCTLGGLSTAAVAV